ncbi:helix-turn-helix transcriptional regulator [Oceanithermus sp.]|uniref:helix-turn-helix domain-containing protein n=1 Tax=Oceanithermus sp. TaxID=2268145 RepID=UPI00258106B5|nr:helix-turn-helix transcriptional regulator [Oceanithermus sp.]
MPQVKEKAKGKRRPAKRRSSTIREPLSENILKAVGEVLRFRRTELGLSQEAVANEVGYKPSTIWNYEAGLKDPWLTMPALKWKNYLEVLGLTEDELAWMIGFEDASVFYGKRAKQQDEELPGIKKIQDVDEEGRPAGTIVLGLPELEPYRESELFVYRTSTGMRIVMKRVKKPKSELLPGELVLIDEGDGKVAAYRFSGWTNKRPTQMIFSQAGKSYLLDPEAVVAKGVLTIGKPELRL